MANERDQVHPFSARVDAPYWDGLADGTLKIQRCDSCREWRWPADWRCGSCGSYDLGWEVVEPTGIVYSWIRTRQPFVAAYADLVPYVNVLVELPQAGGARLMGLLTGDTDDVEVGRRVVGNFQPASARTIDLPVLTWTLEAA
ncbi:Zn-ribbon domain-containing OB-fold protein [Aeromicrobium ginsengisoli]|uniref:DNA-binding protein n=1 Tax=Aeromicrobium ginsengisoli TaxID=363867 RepID=A0A5M4FAI8_9ACTN|nr:zinc ribbon domain-containing protein [Aeromicrobium ginsengisoli]KAA1394259.1 DNA-binding protein [Aeromicrobium ginsengisoli]